MSGIQHFTAGELPSRLIIDCLQTVNGTTQFHLEIKFKFIIRGAGLLSSQLK